MSIEKVEKKLFHYTGKAIADYQMIVPKDNVLVCLSGGKDSFTLLSLLKKAQIKAKMKFSMSVFVLDQGQPGWDDSQLRDYLQNFNVPFEIGRQDTYSVVKEKIPNGKTYCALCSRLRRGNIYQYAKTHGFNKIALGHHRDDLIQTLLMSLFYNGAIRSMPPKLLTDDKSHVVIRPLVYCQEQDIAYYAKLKKFPIIPCNLCGSQQNLVRKKIAQLIKTLSEDNPKIPSNMLNALSNLHPSQLMDKKYWNFTELEVINEDL